MHIIATLFALLVMLANDAVNEATQACPIHRDSARHDFSCDKKHIEDGVVCTSPLYAPKIYESGGVDAEAYMTFFGLQGAQGGEIDRVALKANIIYSASKDGPMELENASLDNGLSLQIAEHYVETGPCHADGTCYFSDEIEIILPIRTNGSIASHGEPPTIEDVAAYLAAGGHYKLHLTGLRGGVEIAFCPQAFEFLAFAASSAAR